MPTLVNPIERLKTGFDMNLLIMDGIWEVQDPQNGPGSGTWFIQIFRSPLTTPGDVECTQVAYAKNGGRPKFRSADQGTWTDWVDSVAGGGAGGDLPQTLQDIADITPTKGRLLVANGTTWVPLDSAEYGDFLISDPDAALGVDWFSFSEIGLSLATAQSPAEVREATGLVIGTNVQAWEADLDTIASLPKTKGNIIVGNGTEWSVLSRGADGQYLSPLTSAPEGYQWVDFPTIPDPVDLSDYYTKEEVDALIPDVSGFETSAHAASTYQPIGSYLVASDLTGYETSAHAASTYQPIGDYLVAADLSDYYTKEQADGRYQPVGSYLVASDLADYLKSADAASTYQPIGSYLVASDLAGYETSSHAASTYQPIGDYLVAADLTGYETSSHAASTYQPIEAHLTALIAADYGDSGQILATDGSSYIWIDAPTGGGGGSLTDGDKGDIVVSGSGAVWVFDSSVVTTFAKTFLDDANAAAVRTTLGLVIGADVQAYDADLAAWAGVNPSSYYTSAQVDTLLGSYLTTSAAASGYQPLDSDLTAIAALTTTSYGRGFLTLADATAARTKIGTVIGTDVQAWDADLDAWALVNPSAYYNKTNIDSMLGSYLTTSAAAAAYQPLDSDLTAIAALTTTTFGRSLLTQADASAARTTLGLVIGTDVQAYDADLAAWAAVNPSSYYTSAQVDTLLGSYLTTTAAAAAYQPLDSDLTAIAALATTSFGRSLLTQAAASNARSTLGVVIGTDVQAFNANSNTKEIVYVIDGGGSAITTGLKGFIRVPFGCTIVDWDIVCDTTGSIVIDLWNNATAFTVPTISDVITASAKPTVSSAQRNQSSTLTGWTTAINANTYFAFNVNSATTVTRAAITVRVTI